ncbi:ribokinase [Rhodobacterales bacterium HKCCE4037]|nr:ribokinase [Rhodobacterales bacterium HKCCE4037]
MPEIIILGVFVADAAYRTAKMPVTGQTLLGTGFQLGPGGKGSNQSVAAAKAGGDVGFLSRIGADTFGQMGRDVWEAAGVVPMVIEDAERPTGSAGIFIEEATGRNAIVIVPGAAGAISASDVEARAAEIAAAKVAMTQLEQPMDAALRFLELASEAGVTTILNPAPAADLPDGLLALCDYVTPNETEAEELTGCKVTGPDDALDAAKALLALGVRKGALITLGENGSLYWDGAEAIHTAPMNAGRAVDTTGAGDAFNGGFACALAEGLAVREALRFATATAALSVTKHGTAASMPARAEIEALL